MNDLVFRLRKRAEIRRQITTRKSVQNNEPDRISDLLEEAASEIEVLQEALRMKVILNEHAQQSMKEIKGAIEMNNKPVAWVEEDNINMSGYQFDFQFVAFSHKPKSEADWIPLYTHPSEHDLGIAEAIGFDKGYKAATAKTLTDEEILNIAFLTATIENDWDNTVLGFARAILRKAQEK